MNKELNQNLTASRIIKTIENHKDEIRKYGVKKIGLFGSFVKKSQHKRSDLDFLVKFGKPKFDNYIELKLMLEKLFHKKVDLVIEGNLKPALRHVRDTAIYAKRI